MLLKFFRYIQGYVTLSLGGDFAERFINICMKRRIVVWNIKRVSQNAITLCMSRRDFLLIRPIAKKTKTKVKIISRHGFKAKMKKHRRRKFFLAGLLMFVTFMFIMSNFIWDIEINGLTYTSKDEMLEILNRNGLKSGTLKQKIDQMQLKNSILSQRSDLSWIWIDIKGTRAIVNVAEQKKPPEIADDAPCDIIASKDGVISSYTATSGTAKIKEGDSVLAGQLLISGVMQSEIINARYTKATGEVFARTWHTKTDTFSTKIYPLCENGKQKTYLTLNIFGKDLNLFFKKNPHFETYNEENYQKDINFFGAYSGLKLKSSVLKQTAPKEQILCEEELLKYAEKKLFEKIIPELSENYTVLNQNISFEKLSDETYKITLTAEFNEQIGISVPIENPIEPSSKPKGENSGE